MKIIKVSSLSGSAEAVPAGGNFDGVYYFDAAFSHLEQVVSKAKAVLITDTNVFENHAEVI